MTTRFGRCISCSEECMICDEENSPYDGLCSQCACAVENGEDNC